MLLMNNALLTKKTALLIILLLKDVQKELVITLPQLQQPFYRQIMIVINIKRVA